MHMVAARFGCKSAMVGTRWVGQEEVSWVTQRMTRTWWLQGLAVKVGPGGPILDLAAWTGLENATLTL